MSAFDRAMTGMAADRGVPDGQPAFLLHADEGTKVLAFRRAGLVFVFNFHPARSFTDYWVPAAPGSYRVLLDTDGEAFGGAGRQDPAVVHHTIDDPIHRHFLSLYLPARTGLVLAPL